MKEGSIISLSLSFPSLFLPLPLLPVFLLCCSVPFLSLSRRRHSARRSKTLKIHKKKKSPTLTLDFYWNWNKFRPASGRIPSSCVCFFSRWVSLLVPGIFRKNPENLPLEESQKTIWIGLRLMALPAGSGSSSHPAKCDTLMKWADSGVTFH